jgi:hypothetical protein
MRYSWVRLVAAIPLYPPPVFGPNLTEVRQNADFQPMSGCSGDLSR